ncbi:hypothetical protein OC187_04070 [Anaplasma capra]|nr:hypothetical protein [Anaplasma capra]
MVKRCARVANGQAATWASEGVPVQHSIRLHRHSQSTPTPIAGNGLVATYTQVLQRCFYSKIPHRSIVGLLGTAMDKIVTLGPIAAEADSKAPRVETGQMMLVTSSGRIIRSSVRVAALGLSQPEVIQFYNIANNLPSVLVNKQEFHVVTLH